MLWPIELSVSFPLAYTLLAISIFTTTYPTHNSSLKWFRLVLAVPTSLVAWRMAYPPTLPSWLPPPAGYIQVFQHGSYVLGRVWDICLVGLWESPKDVPRWIRLKEKQDEGQKMGFSTVPLPTTLAGRLAYTIDNISSSRGSSFFADCSWDWAPKNIQEYRLSSRLEYVTSRSKALLNAIIVMDICEYFLHSRHWNLMISNPISSLPVVEQVWTTLLIGTFAYAGIDFPYIVWGLFWVGVCGFPPSSCPPLFASNNPYTSHLLAEFWSRNWHGMFRRLLDRVSTPIIWLVQRLLGHHLSKSSLNFLRCLIIFSISEVLHIGIAYAIPFSPRSSRRIIELGTLKFLLSQPFGLLFELTVVKPATEGLPGMWKVWLRRAWLWAWILWTGRWFADGYAFFEQTATRNLEYGPVWLLLSCWDLLWPKL
ncbi:hypothetical protein FRB94_012901 [Tulasnella sp. JGI-2019a]|nr:hypothetical protein FRB93_001616 [Tulasnella sp. JGI-2019a]KAG9008804.1 hypothetical protein FRB94_012901 [Tulasnella sp. JGI-2019a]